MSPWLLAGLAALLAATVFLARRPLSPDAAEARLQRLLAQAVDSKRACSHGVLAVEGPGLSVRLACGQAQPGRPMQADTPFLGASVGKLPFVLSLLELAERGELDLDAPLDPWLSADDLALLPAVGPLTLDLLVRHRSGLPDAFDGPSRDGHPTLRQLLTTEPDRRWSLPELLRFAGDHFEPAGRSGDQFRYSDVNYDLAALVVERATGRPFHEHVRERVLRPLRLQDTAYPLLEPERRPLPYADCFYAGRNVARSNALSLERAGGGLATTAEDLVRLGSWLLDHPRSLEQLQHGTTEDALARGIDYGRGLWRIRARRLTWGTLRLPDLLGASGSNGSYLYVAPELGFVFAGTFDSDEFTRAHIPFLLRTLDVAARLRPDEPLTAARLWPAEPLSAAPPAPAWPRRSCRSSA